MADDQAWPGDKGDWGNLTEDLKTRINWARRRALENTGIYITQVSGNRTFQQQVDLRRANCGTSDYAIYHMSPGLCHPVTAIPGTSNHESGRASDLHPGPRSIPEVWTWFVQAGLHGPVLSEDWHVEVRPGASPLPDQPPEPVPPPEDDMPIPNDSLIAHNDGRIFLVNGVTRLASLMPSPDTIGWVKNFYAFAHAANPASPALEDHTNDPSTGTALVDFRVVNIVATQ